MILKARGLSGWIYIDNITFFEKVLDCSNSDGGHTTGEVTYMRNDNGVMTTIPLTTNDAYLLNDDGKTIESLCNLLPGPCEDSWPKPTRI